MPELTPLEKLRLADPETFEQVRQRMATVTPPPGERLDWLVDEIIWALAEEIGFGRAYAQGLLLVWSKKPGALVTYREQVHEAAGIGATLAQIVARHAAPVVVAGKRLHAQFVQTSTIMRAKGTYTLNAPLEALGQLLAAGDHASAEAYLDLLSTVFRQPMNYNQSLRLVYLLPEAVRAFVPRRRRLHIVQTTRLAQTDLQLLDPFLDGLRRGLGLLRETALARFVGEAIERFQRNAPAGRAFLGLESNTGRERCADLQVAVALSQVESTLHQYVRARLGRSVPIHALGELPAGTCPPETLVCSDGCSIYLVDELGHHGRREDNAALYKMLVRLEAGLLEIGTYDFDLERAAERSPEVAAHIGWTGAALSGPACDAEHFVHRFARPALADDLFTVLEHARLTRWMARTYPGLWGRVRPLLAHEAGRCMHQGAQPHPLMAVYVRQVLSERHDSDSWAAAVAAALADHDAATVEETAAAVCRAYAALAACAPPGAAVYLPLSMPFGWRLQWPLVSMAQTAGRDTIERLRAGLAQKGVRLYRSDLRRRLSEQGGTLAADDIKTLLLEPGAGAGAAPLSNLDLSALLQASGVLPAPAAAGAQAHRYREWDCRVQDYLRDHVAVYTKTLAQAPGDLYQQILARRRGLLAHTRRAFELLKPERLKLLRPWREGDDFDYRALLDFAVARRMGRTPSDRLFIKRIKQARDVAVLLLVDLSRSTANTVAGGDATVIQVTQEALVIFCEALKVVGDNFALAGFSGSGRHAVDYFTIKSFDEPLSAGVRHRIAALRPQRSTRMGAAIRHATAGLALLDARVRLLLLISDGFPNDLDYKAEYAVADTRRSIQEARSRNIHVKAITVNIGSDPRLDDLYGRRHHHVIGAVPELPGKLLRLYSTLTRH
jgi:nitric oxide reductase NorD protein